MSNNLIIPRYIHSECEKILESLSVYLLNVYSLKGYILKNNDISFLSILVYHNVYERYTYSFLYPLYLKMYLTPECTGSVVYQN